MDTTLKKPLSTILFSSFLILLLFAGCQAGVPDLVATPQPTLTPAPTSIPTREPLGESSHPIVFGLVGSPEDNLLQEVGANIAAFLSDGTNQSVSYRIFASDIIMLYDMQNSEVHISFQQPMTYLYASGNGFSEAVLLSNHYGLYGYGTQFIANSGSDFYRYFDEIEQRNIAEAETALSQFQGKRPCWVSPTSLSGYLIPAAMLQQNGVQTQDGVFTLSTTATIRALYITGICDFASVYAISGDPRTAEAVQTDLTDVKERISTIWSSDAIIPSMNISMHPDIPTEIQQSLITSLVVMVNTPEGKIWLSDASRYEIEDLKIIEDSHYDPLRSLLEGFEYNPKDFIGF